MVSRAEARAERPRRLPGPRLRYERLPLLALSILSLLAGLWAGLGRLGWSSLGPWPGLYLAHGPLMACGFLGTLISLERAVALGTRWGYAAPLLSGGGAAVVILGVPDPLGPLAIALGSLWLVADFVVLVRRQAAWFTVTMGLGAVAWLVGNVLWLVGTPVMRLFFWWVGFLVLTIVGERLELSRLAGPAGRGRGLFLAGAVVFIGGLSLASAYLGPGLRLAGAGMLFLTLWLWRYDVAWRTVRQAGLTRFIAVNLLAGYVWLGLGGGAWLWFGDALTTFHYDLMLHPILLGFVFSMIFGHAPIIFPAVLGGPLPYRRGFYLHAGLLQASLLLRVIGDVGAYYPAYRWGGLLNVVAILIFVANTARSVVAELTKRSGRGRSAAPRADAGSG